MIVSDFMIKDPVCIDKDDSLKSLNKLVNGSGYTHVPVTNQGQLVGIISKSDLMSRFLVMLDDMGTTPSEEELENLPVETFMTANPAIAFVDDHIDKALDILLESNFHCIVSVNNQNQVRGIVTSYDLLEALNKRSSFLRFAS